ncbi:MAG TPA: PQQ-dependent sugar dehydrogenase, partial [Caldilineaceae bacterium]|nr:PQQ-dependent sugar dehydrogenase [Caldilineaceae bacterium]
APAGNPFVGLAGHKAEIWAMGLRNPWRFSFDRLTGDLYIADVGQRAYEEVNFQPADSPGGENYGWNEMEGNHCYASKECRPELYTLPVAEYGHDGADCSVTGGVVFYSMNAQQPPVYLYGDFCSGRIRGLQRSGAGWATELLAETGLSISSFGYGPAGEVYLVSFNGSIYRIGEEGEPIPELRLRLHFPTIQRRAG